MIHSKKIYAAGATVAIVGLARTGCADSGPTQSGSPTPKEVLTLSVGTAAALTNFSDIYVAESRGYFKQAGLKVNIQTGVGANGLNEVVSGQLDLLMFGVGQALLPVSSGQDTVIVYNQIGAGEGAAIVVKADSPYHTPEDLAGKRVSVLGVGGSSYGWGQYFSKYSQKHGAGPYDLQQTDNTGDQVNGVLSGNYDAMVGLGGAFQKQVADGTVRFVVDPSSPASAKYFPTQYVETATFGIRANLKSKKEAVTRFVAAMAAADSWLKSAKPVAIATELKKNSAFDGQDLAALTSSATYDQPFMAPSLGFVSEGLWKSTLKQLAYWGLPNVDLSSDDFSYAKRVDMSYLDAAKNIKITP